MEKLDALDTVILTVILVTLFLIFIIATFRELNTMSKTSYEDLNLLRRGKTKLKEKQK